MKYNGNIQRFVCDGGAVQKRVKIPVELLKHELGLFCGPGILPRDVQELYLFFRMS